MKKCKISLLLKGVVSLLLALLLHVEAFGQTNTSYLTWDSEVGCIEYDFRYDRKKGYVFDENIENTACLRVCEGSQVNYTVEGSGIASVNWFVTGGNLAGTSGGV